MRPAFTLTNYTQILSTISKAARINGQRMNTFICPYNFSLSLISFFPFFIILLFRLCTADELCIGRCCEKRPVNYIITDSNRIYHSNRRTCKNNCVTGYCSLCSHITQKCCSAKCGAAFIIFRISPGCMAS